MGAVKLGVPYFTSAIALSMFIRSIAFLFRNLPIPQIFIVNVALGVTADILVWTLLLIENKLIGFKGLLFMLGYALISWVGFLMMIQLNLSYIPIVYVVNTIASCSYAIFVFYTIDKHRLSGLQKNPSKVGVDAT